MTALLKTSGAPAERFTSRDPADFPDPSAAQEDWRFSPLAKLRPYFTAFEPDGVVDGRETVPAGAKVEVVDPSTVPAFGTALEPADRVAALAIANARLGLHVQVEAGAQLDDPVLLTRTGRGGKLYAHHIVEIGAGARATVVLAHRGLIEAASNVEFLVGDGAQLTVAMINSGAEGTIHLSAHGALIGRDASFKHVNLTLGGSIVRVVPTVRFAAPGGRAELFGVSLAGDGQHFENRLFVDHGAPHCSSNVVYKNALLGDSARTVWIGDVRIRPAAIGTETYEMNRNLLLAPGARADSVPNLEIETGDIAGAGHASATGRFDDQQLFYLQSRGIPEAEARRMVVRAFFADVIEQIGVPELQQRILSAIEAQLGFAPDTAEEFDLD